MIARPDINAGIPEKDLTMLYNLQMTSGKTSLS
jgi:hypothetical protein